MGTTAAGDDAAAGSAGNEVVGRVHGRMIELAPVSNGSDNARHTRPITDFVVSTWRLKPKSGSEVAEPFDDRTKENRRLMTSRSTWPLGRSRSTSRQSAAAKSPSPTAAGSLQRKLVSSSLETNYRAIQARCAPMRRALRLSGTCTSSPTAMSSERPAPRVVVGLPICVTSEVSDPRERLAQRFARYEAMPSYRAMLDREGLDRAGAVAIVGDEASVQAQLDELAEAGTTDLLGVVVGTPSEVEATTAALRSRL